LLIKQQIVAFRFGEFEVDFQLYELRRAGELTRVDRKVFDLLRYLIEHRERVVEKHELLRDVWGGEVVVDAVVPTAIARLRKALGQSGADSTPIQTIHGRGYRFNAPLASMPARAPVAGAERRIMLVDTDIHPGLRDPFVGRDAVMERLNGALEKALRGIMRARLLTGDPGIGKTRLCQELGSRAREAGARVWSGRCYEADSGEGLWPWVQILRQAVDAPAVEALRSLPETALVELTTLVPELRATRAPLASSVAVGKGLPLFDAVARFLRASAQRVPLVLVLDDLHWADTASLTLLGYLLEELTGARIFVLGTFRDAELTPGHPHTALLDRLERSSSWKRIALDALEVPDVALYVQELTGQLVPDALAERIHECTAGNPFFVRETVRSLTADALAEGHLRLAEINVPESARDVMRRRVAALPEPTQRVLEAGSVLGLRLELGTLSAMLELDNEALLSALDRAVAARLLVRDQEGLGRYAFVHTLVRDTLDGDLSTSRRCELHLAAGTALERQRALRKVAAAEIALHLYRALPRGDAHKACEQAKLAAEEAATAGQHEQAAEWYRRAHEGLGFVQDADADRSAEVMLGLGRAHRQSGHPVAAREALDRVLELSASSGAAESWAVAARIELERLDRTP
jgi:predicted ATPase/DNA-binding winged helix-turn-helix (wHTH) protein